ncbi:hypothetical protein NT04LM_4098 [Listeria monocytogenes FSL F2-208]|nr:hypothetical protein NT04LM_4098 [Listeria monocytogenes FSL F2-208]
MDSIKCPPMKRVINILSFSGTLLPIKRSNGANDSFTM